MKKRVLFIIQGEGRGHMTQSLALKEILEKENYEVNGAIIGSSSRRKIPEFISTGLQTEIHEVRSPNFVTDTENKGLDITRSITFNLGLLPKFYSSLQQVDRIVKRTRPDLIFNFYEPLAGLYNRFFGGKHKTICVAHQYLSIHPGFNMPEGFLMEKKSLQFFSKLTAWGSDAKLGLSFYEMKDDPGQSIFVVPPLLRHEVKNAEISEDKFLLIYLLNKGYKSNIEAWHRQNPEISIHCFSDDPEVKDEHIVDQTLTYHQLNGQKFLEKMAACMALVSTAGFESVCEAMYMNKPALMVPVEGHYEQFINSRDAHSAGAGVYSDHFDIDKLMNYLREGKRKNEVFKKWADQSGQRIMRIVNRIMHE